jgi:uncharacterized protein
MRVANGNRNTFGQPMTHLRALVHLGCAPIGYRQRHRAQCRLPSWVFLPAMMLAGLGVGGEAAHAQAPPPAAKEARASALEEQWRAKLNANPVAIMAGSPNETYLSVTHDLAVLLNGDDLRILPIAGLGGAQNIPDVLFLRGIDAGYFASTGELGAALDQRLDDITKRFVEEMHVAAQSDIADIEGLSGKRVNFSDEGSTTQMTARDVFGMLSIKV